MPKRPIYSRVQSLMPVVIDIMNGRPNGDRIRIARVKVEFPIPIRRWDDDVVDEEVRVELT